jgi:hypothetical protein
MRTRIIEGEEVACRCLERQRGATNPFSDELTIQGGSLRLLRVDTIGSSTSPPILL